MADYYPLLSRAVGALSDSSADARRSIYDRARKALVGQLQAIQPPIAEADIARETDALDEAVARIEAEMQAIRPETSLILESTIAIPPLVPEPDGAAERLARALTGDNGTHVVSYQTEAGQFQERGLSTVVCGPGSITEAHQPDEYLSLDQLSAAETFIRRLIRHLSE